jgi:hypothetical protein
VCHLLLLDCDIVPAVEPFNNVLLKIQTVCDIVSLSSSS